jgi:hypothetical protein
LERKPSRMSVEKHSAASKATPGRFSRILSFALKPVSVAAGLLVIALIVVQCTYPGGVAAASKDVSQTMSSLVKAALNVGPHTVAQQFSGEEEALRKAIDAIPQDQKDRMWKMARPTRVFALEKKGTSTEVTFTLDFQPKRLAKLMDPMITKQMRVEVAALEGLKKRLEGAASRP